MIPSTSKDEDHHEFIPANASEAFDYLLRSVGNKGRWQWKITFICGFTGIYSALHVYSAIFLAATPDYWCDVTGASNYTYENSYQDLNAGTNITIQGEIGKNESSKPSKCYYSVKKIDELFLASSEDASLMTTTLNPEYYSYQTISNDTKELKCTKWKFKGPMTTIVTEWNLVCDDDWLKPTVQATFMMGVLIGSIVASATSDKYGRRPATIGCAVIFFPTSVLASFTHSLWLFIILRFLVGASAFGMYLVNFVIVMEVVGIKNRDFFGVLYATFFSIGGMILAGSAYYLTEWRSLQLAISVPGVLLFSYYWIMPESPRWLFMHGKIIEGTAVMELAGRVNGGKELPGPKQMKILIDVIDDEILRTTQKDKSNQIFLEYFRNVFKLIRTPNMRRRSLIMFYCWFTISMSSFGLNFSGENINASLHLMLIMTSSLEFPGFLLSYYTGMRFGRRVTLAYSMVIAGLSCVAVLFVPKEFVWINLVLVLIGLKLLSIAFRTCYFFSTELAPTDIRNNSIGIASVFARIGSALSPYIVNLLGEIYYSIPSTIFGILCLIGGILTFFLPETAKQKLPETIEEIELLPK